MSNRYRGFFSAKHTVFPVIHAASVAQVLRNVNVARNAGADGAFVINHGSLTACDLFRWYRVARAEFPRFWLGINCLDLSASVSFALLGLETAGVWVDDLLSSAEDVRLIDKVCEVQRAFPARGVYFGGTAFKYQRPVTDIAGAAQVAMQHTDVVVTSGDATGQPPTVEKVRCMKTAIGDFPLAIASGMTPDNVSDFLPYADCFLVATGVSLSFNELDPHKLSRFIERVRKGEEQHGTHTRAR